MQIKNTGDPCLVCCDDKNDEPVMAVHLIIADKPENPVYIYDDK